MLNHISRPEIKESTLKRLKTNLTMSKTESFATANGRVYIIDAKTKEVLTSRDRYGNIYNSKGKKEGHIDD